MDKVKKAKNDGGFFYDIKSFREIGTVREKAG